MKKNISIILICLLGLFVLGVIKDQVARLAVGVGAKTLLGTDVDVGGLSLGVLNQRVVIKNLRVYNPKGFEKGVLLYIPKIDVNYDLAAFFKKKLHLKNIAINLDEMLIIKNKDGKLNVDALKISKTDNREGSKPSEAMPMQIDNLELSIGRVAVKDLEPAKPFLQVYEVNLEKKVFKNITSAQQMASLVMVQAMGPTAIRGAAIYGAASLAGVAFLPLGAALLFTSSDNVVQDFNLNLKEAYELSFAVAKELGEISEASLDKGSVQANINGHGVNITLVGQVGNKTKITVSARKFGMPKREVAAGVLYEIKNKSRR